MKTTKIIDGFAVKAAKTIDGFAVKIAKIIDGFAEIGYVPLLRTVRNFPVLSVGNFRYMIYILSFS